MAYRAMPYKKENYNWKDFRLQSTLPPGAVINYANTFANRGLHRIHFHHRTLSEEQVYIKAARSCENQSKDNTNPSIEDGPLSLFARDQLKYQEAFTGKKLEISIIQSKKITSTVEQFIF